MTADAIPNHSDKSREFPGIDSSDRDWKLFIARWVFRQEATTVMAMATLVGMFGFAYYFVRYVEPDRAKAMEAHEVRVLAELEKMQSAYIDDKIRVREQFSRDLGSMRELFQESLKRYEALASQQEKLVRELALDARGRREEAKN